MNLIECFLPEKKNIFFRILLFIAFIASGMPYVQAQDEILVDEEKELSNSAVDFSFGADLTSSYIWRGINFGNSPAIQPAMAFSTHGFSIGAWGSYAFSRTGYPVNDSLSLDYHYTELDLSIAYTYKYFTLMVTDFYAPSPVDSAPGNDYFNWKSNETFHTLEAAFIFDGPEKVPLRFLASVFFYGADKDKDSTGVYGWGPNNNYSTYFELSYLFQAKKLFIRPYIGGIPFGSSFYGPKAGITNIGVNLSREIAIVPKYAIVLQGNLIFNPLDKKAYLVFMISL